MLDETSFICTLGKCAYGLCLRASVRNAGPFAEQMDQYEPAQKSGRGASYSMLEDTGPFAEQMDQYGMVISPLTNMLISGGHTPPLVSKLTFGIF